MTWLLGLIFWIAAAVLAAFALTHQSGTAQIVWHGYVIETSAAFLCIAVAAIAVLFQGALRLVRLIRHGPGLMRVNREMKTLRQGYKDLTAGLIAVASGDAFAAGRSAVAARKRLGTTAATQLLQAQAAQLAGDYRSARGLFKALTEDSDSAVLGYRGLIMEARRAGDIDELQRLADEMHHLKSDVPWLKRVRFDLALAQQKWDEAGALLATPQINHLIGVDRARQSRAALLLIAAERAVRHRDTQRALQAAEQAVKQVPDWLPAIIALARYQMADGHRRAAHRTIEKNWEAHAHPDLAHLYISASETPLQRYRLMEQLGRHHPEIPLSAMMIAEAALAADLWGEARRYLQILVNRGQATQNTYRMLAKLERHEHHNEKAAVAWGAAVINASPDPVWLCQTCGQGHAEWQPTCSHCHSFITLEWQTPGVGRSTAPINLLAATSDWIA